MSEGFNHVMNYARSDLSKGGELGENGRKPPKIKGRTSQVREKRREGESKANPHRDLYQSALWRVRISFAERYRGGKGNSAAVGERRRTRRRTIAVSSLELIGLE